MVRPRSLHVGEQRLQHRDGAVVERGERLVEQQHFGIVQKGARHRQPLPHAARKFAHQAIADALEAGAFQQFVGPLAWVGQAVEAAEEHQILDGGKLVVKRDAVAQDADAAAGGFLREPRRLWIFTEPLDGFEKPARMRSSVVLPAPLRPSSATVEPAATRSRTSRRAGKSP